MTFPVTMKRTKRDAANLYTVSAFGWLLANNQRRALFGRLERQYIKEHGQVFVNAPWQCKDQLGRQLGAVARMIVEAEDRAYQAWRMAGRRRESLTPHVERSRIVERWNGTIPEGE